MRKLHEPIAFTRDEVLTLVQAQECPRCLGVSQPEPGDRVGIVRTSSAFIVEWKCPACRPRWWPFGGKWLSGLADINDILRARRGLPPDSLLRHPEGFRYHRADEQ